MNNEPEKAFEDWFASQVRMVREIEDKDLMQQSLDDMMLSRDDWKGAFLAGWEKGGEVEASNQILICQNGEIRPIQIGGKIWSVEDVKQSTAKEIFDHLEKDMIWKPLKDGCIYLNGVLYKGSKVSYLELKSKYLKTD